MTACHARTVSCSKNVTTDDTNGGLSLLSKVVAVVPADSAIDSESRLGELCLPGCRWEPGEQAVLIVAHLLMNQQPGNELGPERSAAELGSCTAPSLLVPDPLGRQCTTVVRRSLRSAAERAYQTPTLTWHASAISSLGGNSIEAAETKMFLCDENSDSTTVTSRDT